MSTDLETRIEDGLKRVGRLCSIAARAPLSTDVLDRPESPGGSRSTIVGSHRSSPLVVPERPQRRR